MESMSEIRPGGRVERQEIALFDAMMAEICGEQEARLRKFERTHYVRSDKKHIKKDRRDNRSRLTRYFDRDLDNRFPMRGKFPEMTIRRYRAETRERSTLPKTGPPAVRALRKPPPSSFPCFAVRPRGSTG